MILAPQRRCITLIVLLFTAPVQPTALDLRIGGFIPSASLFREIYGTVIPSYQIEASFPFYDCFLEWSKHCFQAWTNLSYFNTSGKSVPLHVKCRLQLVPLSAGLKYVYHLRNDFVQNLLDVYAGAGLCYTWLKENNDCRLINTAHHVGGIVKFGVAKTCKHARFSLFGDYLIQRFNVGNSHGHKVNTDGFLFGGAIGVSF